MLKMRGDEEGCIASIVGVRLICLMDNSTKTPQSTEYWYRTAIQYRTGKVLLWTLRVGL